ncbi:HepT-like ribonuclease domain-containing protein [Chitinophaga sp.]|uniref:HepT-like ribonuclease domain-containing protein n=1 Tax=Chitinophaga sp. TaxID=1869181 RepID=UPI0025C21AAD|nr:HepT-like ribonuclease domain-containing protein [Chitinophaga sp.]
MSEIESYTTGKTASDFFENSMMRFAAVKQIEIIGEAANLLTAELRDRYTDVAWRQIIGLRHILVHEYFGIDAELIWQIIENDIPVLKERIEDILSSID